MAQSKNDSANSGDKPENQEGAYKKNEYANESPGIRFDDFIKKIKPDPNSKEQVILLYGYVGESTSEDRIRLYTDASLADYVEIAKSAIVHSLPNDNDPLGGSRLWVKQAANIQQGNASAYTQGDMYNDFMQNQFTPGQNFDTGAGGAANPALFATAACPSVGIACPSVVIACQSLVCPTLRTNCPSLWLALCPTRNIIKCITPGGQRTICRPCFVTPQFETPQTPVTQTPVINPAQVAGGGFMNDPYGTGWGGDFTQGDMYNDFMQNQFTPGQNLDPVMNFASGPGIVCQPGATFGICPSVVICPNVTNNPHQCLQLKTRNIGCPTRLLAFCTLNRCITQNGQRTICRPCFVTPQFETPQTPVTQTPVINPGTQVAGGGFMNDPYGTGWGGDFTQGDMYNDFMQNQFTPGQNFGPGAAIPVNTVACPITIRNCPSFTIICQTQVAICFTRFNCPSRTVICQSIGSPCVSRGFICPSFVDACPTRIQCFPVTPNLTVVDPTPTFGQFNEGDAGFAQGYDPNAYGDFTQGGLYNDYLQDQFTPEMQGLASEGQVPTPPQTVVIACRRTLIPQLCPTNPINPQCRVTNIVNLICRTRPVLCRTINVINCPSFGIVCPQPSVVIRCPF